MGSADGFLCVEAARGADGRGRSGWIPARRVRMVPNHQATHPLRWWRGLWVSDGSWISIAVSKGEVRAAGGSVWQGRSDPHFGDFRGASKPSGDEVDFASPGDYGCALRLLAMGRNLAVTDNGQCGGTNVTFSGFYRRQAPRRR